MNLNVIYAPAWYYFVTMMKKDLVNMDSQDVLMNMMLILRLAQKA